MKKSFLFVGVIVIAIIIVAGIFIFNSGSQSIQNSSGNEINQSAPLKIITLDASRFDYSPGTITVNKGDHVRIIINSVDTTHGIAIPDFGVSGIESVDFIADKSGTFDFHCPTPCGSGHRDMKGTLIVQ